MIHVGSACAMLGTIFQKGPQAPATHRCLCEGGLGRDCCRAQRGRLSQMR